jgi:ATP-binding cassette subfamily B protein
MTLADTTPTQQDRLHTIAEFFPEKTIKPEFEPLGETPHYKPAKGTFDPDNSKNWFWRIFPILYAHKLLVIVSLSMSFAVMLIGTTIPALTAAVIDDALLGVPTPDRIQNAIRSVAYVIDGVFFTDTNPLLAYVCLIVALGIGSGLLSFGSAYTHARLTFSIDYDLRTIIYNHLTKLSFSFFDRSQSGQLISRANSDIQAITWFLTGAPNLFQTVVQFVLALSYMLTMHVGLTLVAIVILPGVYILSSRMRRVMYPLSWLNQSRVAEMTTIADENINGVRVVKSFAAEKRQIKLFSDAAESLRWARVEDVKLHASFQPLISALPVIGLTLILLYGGHLVMQGKLTIGSLLAFNTYVMMVAGPAHRFSMFLMQYERARASALRIYEVLDEKSEIVESPDAVDLTDPKGKIEFRDTTFSYHQSPTILEGFDLTIMPGEAVAIVGRTGSGKSTIARLLSRFYDVSNGAVCVDGHDVRDLSVVSLRASIGMVLDEPFLFSTSVRDNIAYGRPEASLDEVVHAAKSASAHEFICELPEGYDSVIGERGYTLSGGQRQRIAIARTLLINPRILVLDDATSSIDVQVEAEIHEALRALMKDRTAIVIAHRLSTILLADRVVLMAGGKIVASGTHSELMVSEPRYVEVLARAEEEDEMADKERSIGDNR